MFASCEKIEDDKNLTLIYERLSALAHPTRLKIVCALKDQEYSVKEIVRSVGGSQSNISQQLKILTFSRILSRRKSKNHVYYSVKDPQVMHLLEVLSN